jgi:hypothetical protein
VDGIGCQADTAKRGRLTAFTPACHFLLTKQHRLLQEFAQYCILDCFKSIRPLGFSGLKRAARSLGMTSSSSLFLNSQRHIFHLKGNAASPGGFSQSPRMRRPECKHGQTGICVMTANAQTTLLC